MQANNMDHHTRSYQYDQILKKNEQMYALLAITLSMSPQHTVDDNLQSTLREKFGERMARMQANNMDIGAYEDLFCFACPKFVSPAPPKYDDLPANYNAQEAYKLQLHLFCFACPKFVSPAPPKYD